jgi:hypothetical protein
MELLNDDSWSILVAAFNTFTTQNILIIFDTGASLLIPPEKGGLYLATGRPAKNDQNWLYDRKYGNQGHVHRLMDVSYI